MEHVWKIGDKFEVVGGAGDHHCFNLGDIVTLIELCNDGGHGYKDGVTGEEQWLYPTHVRYLGENKEKSMEHVWKVGDKAIYVGESNYWFTNGCVYTVTNTCSKYGSILFTTNSGGENGWASYHVNKVFEFVEDIQQQKKHSHYFKKCSYDYIDVYRVLEMFDVTDPCIAHATKKLLCAGARGVKDTAKDIQEAIDTLVRYQEMREEEKDNV